MASSAESTFGNVREAHGEDAVHPAWQLLEPFTKERAIDLTAFMGQWPTRLQIRASTEDLIAMADRLGLSAMCVSHIASIFGFDTRSGNEELFRRLVPGYHGYSLASPEVAELIARLSGRHLTLHICARLEDDRLVHPRFPIVPVPFHEIAELLRLTEDMPVILSGLRAREWDSVSEHLNAGHRTDKVMLDLWFTNGPIGAIASLSRGSLTKRLGYGSCFPIQVPEATALQLAAADIGADKRAALCRGNAAGLLGID
ncbi:MAG: hypothetical protein K0R28_5290 [Paenibacillus sp.]|nr:hypothetical protein [Paenibacillus sp.]